MVQEVVVLMTAIKSAHMTVRALQVADLATEALVTEQMHVQHAVMHQIVSVLLIETLLARRAIAQAK